MSYDTYFRINLPKLLTMGGCPEGLLLDPNTGDNMVEKDDFFQEEDGIDAQNHGGDEPSSGEEDDILDLTDVADVDDAEDAEVLDLMQEA